MKQSEQRELNIGSGPFSKAQIAGGKYVERSGASLFPLRPLFMAAYDDGGIVLSMD